MCFHRGAFEGGWTKYSSDPVSTISSYGFREKWSMSESMVGNVVSPSSPS
eukprot:m.109217 g.109217  ORF g.109217 m.109217 type:complete len:50 (-) comp27934_c2_seq3:2219-2368(-)